MAAQPIPRPEDSTQVDIDANGNVTGEVHVDNGGVVKFNVTGYKPGYNTCIVTFSSGNITWGNSLAQGGNTIKVGSGGGGAAR